MKQFGAFRLDPLNECLWQGEARVALPPRAFGVLRYLVEHPGRLITHDELLDALWPDTYVQPQVLRTYVLDLRRVLGDDAGQPRYIQTLPKRGYCFVAAVSEGSGPDQAPAAKRELEARVDSCAGGTSDRARTVGRTEEMARLTEQVKLVAEGRRRIVFLSGEAGIGKTALVDEFSRQVRLSLPIQVACAQCIEGFGDREEYYPVMEALEQLCGAPDGETTRRILARKAPAWVSALRQRLEDTAAVDAGAGAQERRLGDLCAALEELSQEKPLLLLFEDLHWADSGTLHLISALARRQAPAQLLVIGTFGLHGALEQLKSMKQDLLMRRLCVEITLGPLSHSAVGELLHAELKDERFPPELTGFVHQHAEGNPLFVIALAEHLVAQRVLVREADGWKQRTPFEEMGVPDGLAQMIELEIGSLTPEEQRILEAGSLSDVVFPAWAVAAALDEDVPEIEEACDRLARRLFFLRRCGEDELPDGSRSAFYVFAHGLYREVLYQRQAGSRRARQHIRIAERLRELFSGRAASVAREMAMHYEAAGSWQQAVDALRDAARYAQERQAHSEVLELLGRALRVAENLSEPEWDGTAREIRGELMQAQGASLDQRLGEFTKA